MVPFIVLIVSALLLRAAGLAGVSALGSWSVCLRIAFALTFVLTASAHWGSRRKDLVAMVPKGLPQPELLVTATGVLEILGAIGLLPPATARVAAVCLIVLLLLLFPANVKAAREGLMLGGREATPLLLRSGIQLVFVGLLAVVALGIER